MRGSGIKIIILSALIVTIFLCMISFVESNSVGVSIGGQKTLVSGEVYYAYDDAPVDGADVYVKCKSGIKNMKEEVVTGEDGQYYAIFEGKIGCNENSRVTVIATKEDLTGTNSGKVHNYRLEKMDVAFGFAPPIVPEFGLIAGMITLLGALGVFFFIRKK
jgi:hypothetical protein